MHEGTYRDRHEPDYDLSSGALTELEAALIKDVSGNPALVDCMAAVWLQPYSRFANIVITHEARFFPEVRELSGAAEDNTFFLAIVDTRPASNRVVHAATITRPPLDVLYRSGASSPAFGQTTGFHVIDDLIEMGNFTGHDFRKYYAAQGIDLNKCISIETHFRVGAKAPRYQGVRTAELAYAAIWSLFRRSNPQPGRAVIFANVNRASVLSLKLMGLRYQPLMGRNDLNTSESLRGLSFSPIVIPYTDDNLRVVSQFTVSLPEIIR